MIPIERKRSPPHSELLGAGKSPFEQTEANRGRRRSALDGARRSVSLWRRFWRRSRRGWISLSMQKVDFERGLVVSQSFEVSLRCQALFDLPCEIAVRFKVD